MGGIAGGVNKGILVVVFVVDSVLVAATEKNI